MADRPTILIVGASTRAAAFSALRAGWRPLCADLHADLDLSAYAAATRVAGADYPDSLAEAARNAPPGPWMYTGALENYPRLVAAISQSGHAEEVGSADSARFLWGNPPEALLSVRDPLRVADCLKAAGLPCPHVQAEKPDDRNGIQWLWKPRASGGGFGIGVARIPGTSSRTGSLPPIALAGGTELRERLSRRFFDSREGYWQEYVTGMPCAAVYAADGRLAVLLGVTRQLIGESTLHAKRFQYCGSIGPLALSAKQRESFSALGGALAHEFGLRGLFGVDAVLHDGVPWPVEVNPRYTASVEVLEYAHARSAFEAHRAIFSGELGIERLQSQWQASPNGYVGKAILFAPEDLRAPDTHAWLVDSDPLRLSKIADVPHPGEVIRAGRPVMTVFARAGSEQACWSQLQTLAAEHYARFDCT